MIKLNSILVKSSWISAYFGELVYKNDGEVLDYYHDYCKVCFLINYNGATSHLNHLKLSIARYKKSTSLNNHSNHLIKKHNFMRNSAKHNNEQLSIINNESNNQVKEIIKPPQEEFLQLITIFLVSTFQPFQLVEHEAFKNLFQMQMMIFVSRKKLQSI